MGSMSAEYACAEWAETMEICLCGERTCNYEEYCIGGRCYDKCSSYGPFNWPCLCGGEFSGDFCSDNQRCVDDRKEQSCLPCDINIFNEYCVCNEFETHCRLCEDKKCTACNFGYYLLDGECHECKNYTETACTCIKTGKNTLEEFNEEIQRTKCQTCEDSLRCKTCINNTYFIPDGHLCQSCPGNDSFCFCGGTTDGKCKECEDEYFNRCSSCFDGHFINSMHECSVCGANGETNGCFCGGTEEKGCEYCDGNTCAVCLPSWYLSEGECIQCTEHCLACTGDGDCLECDEFSYLDNNECITCEDTPFSYLEGGVCVCDDYHLMINGECHSIVVFYIIAPLCAVIIVTYVITMLALRKKHCFLEQRD